MPSAWINHVKEFAKSKGMSYMNALKSAECKSSYKESKGGEIKTAVMPKTILPNKKPNIELVIKELSAKKGKGKGMKHSKPAEPDIDLDTEEARKIEAEQEAANKKAAAAAAKAKRKAESQARKAAQQAEEAQKEADLEARLKERRGGVVINTERRKRAAERAVKEAAEAAELAKDSGSGLPVKKGRGRPKKYTSPEEAKKAKSAKTMESNKRKKTAKPTTAVEGKGIPNPLVPPPPPHLVKPIKIPRVPKLKLPVEGEGLNVGYKTEAPNGLAHIYPISHALVLQMLSCCPK